MSQAKKWLHGSFYTMIENAWPIISYVSLHDVVEDVIFVHINRVVTDETYI